MFIRNLFFTYVSISYFSVTGQRQTIDSLVVDWKLKVLPFFLRFLCSEICQFVKSTGLFSSRFTRSPNMTNQISQIRVTAKKASQQEQTFFFNALLFFSACLCHIYKSKSPWSNDND